MSRFSHTSRATHSETMAASPVIKAGSGDKDTVPARRPSGPVSAPHARGHILRSEWKRLIDDLGTLILAGLCIAGAVIVASTFDGDLQGGNEIVAAILGTLSLFGLLAGLELADRLKMRCRGTR